jgi:hypothetical protein
MGRLGGASHFRVWLSRSWLRLPRQPTGQANLKLSGIRTPVSCARMVSACWWRRVSPYLSSCAHERLM